jgi:hypothetical protein
VSALKMSGDATLEIAKALDEHVRS